MPAWLSVVAPMHQEAGNIEAFLQRTAATCLALPEIQAGQSWEIILVDDGSRDATWPMIAETASRLQLPVRAARLSRNFGHQAALMCGLGLATGTIIVSIDGDLQDPPEAITAMVDAWRTDHWDVIHAVRRRRAGESWAKLLTAWCFYRLLAAVSGVPLVSDSGDFRLYSRRALQALLSLPERHRYIRGMAVWIGFPQGTITYDRHPRLRGTTGYTWSKMIRFATDAICSFSSAPMRVTLRLGLLGAAGATLYLLYAIWIWSQHIGVPGWSSVIAVITLLGSIQLICLGMIGEYIARIYEESKGRPSCIIADQFPVGAAS